MVTYWMWGCREKKIGGSLSWMNGLSTEPVPGETKKGKEGGMRGDKASYGHAEFEGPMGYHGSDVK